MSKNTKTSCSYFAEILKKEKIFDDSFNLNKDANLPEFREDDINPIPTSTVQVIENEKRPEQEILKNTINFKRIAMDILGIEQELKPIVITGATGSGKSMIIEELKRKFPDVFVTPKIHTTNSELKGMEYLEKEKFEEEIKNDSFIEYDQEEGTFTGITKKSIEKIVGTKGKTAIFELKIETAKKLQEIYDLECVVIFISPASIEAIENRLKEQNMNEEELKMKIVAIEKQMKERINFKYVLENIKIPDTAESIWNIVKNENEGLNNTE